MSISEYKALELATFKPKLKFRPGELVMGKNDAKKTRMVIYNLLADGATENINADYYCAWITNQRKLKIEPFEQKELIKINA